MKANYSLDDKVKYVCLRNYYVKYNNNNGIINLLNEENNIEETILILEEFGIYDVVKRTMFYTNKEGKDYNIVWYDISVDSDDRFISLKEEEAKIILMPLCDFREGRIESILQ